jgi:hypothetical protein
MAKPLTVADRCDACGAEAKLRAFFKSGELMFCAHHGKRFFTQLVIQATSVDDPNNALEVKAPASSSVFTRN